MLKDYLNGLDPFTLGLCATSMCLYACEGQRFGVFNRLLVTLPFEEVSAMDA